MPARASSLTRRPCTVRLRRSLRPRARRLRTSPASCRASLTKLGEGHGVLPPGEAVEVPDVPAGKALAIQPQDALDLGGRSLAAGRAHPPPVIQGHRATGFVAGAPAPHAARVQTEDVRSLQPRDGSTQCANDDLLDLHGPSTAAAA